jgi:predicted ABC-type ATPase
MTSRLRELIQQLGEAIHESVIESEQIAGVVQDIRQHGFDVLLMLEATIGLNEVAAKEIEAAEAGGEGVPFTQNDLHFLRSLRISIEGEEKSGDEPKAK